MFYFTKWCYDKVLKSSHLSGPDSSVVRASASGEVDRGFVPRQRHTLGDKNGTGSSLADARNKKSSARKIQDGR